MKSEDNLCLLQKMADGYGKTPVPAEALQWLKWKGEEGKKLCTIETRTHCQKNSVEE